MEAGSNLPVGHVENNAYFFPGIIRQTVAQHAPHGPRQVGCQKFQGQGCLEVANPIRCVRMIILLQLADESLVLDTAFAENVISHTINESGSIVSLQIAPDFSIFFESS